MAAAIAAARATVKTARAREAAAAAIAGHFVDVRTFA